MWAITSITSDAECGQTLNIYSSRTSSQGGRDGDKKHEIYGPVSGGHLFL